MMCRAVIRPLLAGEAFLEDVRAADPGAGDTIPYDGLAARVRQAAGPGGIDVALLPINGRVPERRVVGNLWGDEAAAAAHEIGALHFEMFAFNTEPPDAFAAACSRLDQPSACSGPASG
jgi:hypothetical protein